GSAATTRPHVSANTTSRRTVRIDPPWAGKITIAGLPVDEALWCMSGLPVPMRYSARDADSRTTGGSCQANSTSRPGGVEVSSQGVAVDRAPPDNDLCDTPRVSDVVQRVGVEDDEVGLLTRGEYSGGSQPQVIGAAARCGHDCLHRRHPGFHHQLELA